MPKKERKYVWLLFRTTQFDHDTPSDTQVFKTAQDAFDWEDAPLEEWDNSPVFRLVHKARNLLLLRKEIN